MKKSQISIRQLTDKSQISNGKKGFSLVELIFIMSIVTILLGLTTINLSGAQRQATLQAVVQDFISDLRQQQIKAMIGDTEGRPSSDTYGIHIDPNQYVLFHGSYMSGDLSNFVISLPTNIQFTSSSTDISFDRITGETSTVTVTLKDTISGNTKAIQLNRYGVVIGVN